MSTYVGEPIRVPEASDVALALSDKAAVICEVVSKPEVHSTRDGILERRIVDESVRSLHASVPCSRHERYPFSGQVDPAQTCIDAHLGVSSATLLACSDVSKSTNIERERF